MPCSSSLKPFVNMGENIILKSQGASAQPYFTPLVTGKAQEHCPLFRTWTNMPSWNWHTILMNFSGQPNFDIIFHKLSQRTVSKALVRSKNVMYRPLFCSWRFSWSCQAANTILTVPWPFLKPHWLSGIWPASTWYTYESIYQIIHRVEDNSVQLRERVSDLTQEKIP